MRLSRVMLRSFAGASGSEVGGYMVMVLGVTSLDRLLQAVREWEKRMVKKGA